MIEVLDFIVSLFLTVYLGSITAYFSVKLIMYVSRKIDILLYRFDKKVKNKKKYCGECKYLHQIIDNDDTHFIRLECTLGKSIECITKKYKYFKYKRRDS